MAAAALSASVALGNKRLGLPALNEVMVCAERLARRVAHREADVDDLVQHAMFAYCRTVKHRSVHRRESQIRNGLTFARRVLYKAMLTYYYYSYPKKGKHYHLSTQDYKKYEPIDHVASVGNDAQENLFDHLSLQDYLTALERECGRTARVF